MLKPQHLLFTYLHLAADKPQAEGLMKSGATCIAYETVTGARGGLPLLKPMSEVAGRMSVQVGAHYLEKEQGGRGVLLGGVPGVAPRSEEHTSELQSLMRISYAVFCLKKKTRQQTTAIASVLHT